MYRSTVRFNEKELSYFAVNLAPDKEGLLEKKGAVRGQGGTRLKLFPYDLYNETGGIVYIVY